MSTIPTQNPVPSEAAKDLKFNSGKIDEFVTSSNHFYSDRFGKKHYTIEGINNLSKQAMQNYGYITKRSFESGNTIINPNDVLLWEYNGEYYRWDGELPKVVSAGSTPESAGGLGDGKWKSIGDNSLRRELKEGNGSLIGVGNGITLDTKLSSMLSAVDYGFVGDVEGDSTPVFSKMQQDAMDAGIRVIYFPKETSFNLESTVLTNSNTILVGNADIKTSNPNNRYIKCHKDLNTPQEVGYINLGDLSTLANAVLSWRHNPSKSVKVVFVGDSLLMGGQHRHDYTGIADKLKSSISNGVNANCVFYNRAIAGSSLGELLGKIPAYAQPSEFHAPGEEVWITDKDRSWMSYIEDIQPDLVVIGFGMNSFNANDAHNCPKVRGKIKGLASKPSIIWLTTPMRTIDASKVHNNVGFGTYPDNEYSNTSGISYGMYGRLSGDTVIDANRASNIVMLGIDPLSCYMNQLPPQRHSISGDAKTSINNIYIEAILNDGAFIKSIEYARDGAVELIPNELTNTIRLRMRNDPKSTNSIYVDISNTDIKLFTPSKENAASELTKRVEINSIGKLVRFQALGSRVFVAVDSVIVIDIYDVYNAQFQSNISIQSVNGSCKLSGIRFFNAKYKENPPLLTTDEIFSSSIKYGLAGNSLNHPNTTGVEYIYGDALKQLSEKLLSFTVNNSLVKASSSPILPVGISGSIDLKRNGNSISIIGSDISGKLDKDARLVQVNSLYIPEKKVITTCIRVSATGVVDIIGVSINNNGDISFTSALVNDGSKSSFSITFNRMS